MIPAALLWCWSDVDWDGGVAIPQRGERLLQPVFSEFSVSAELAEAAEISEPTPDTSVTLQSLVMDLESRDGWRKSEGRRSSLERSEFRGELGDLARSSECWVTHNEVKGRETGRGDEAKENKSRNSLKAALATVVEIQKWAKACDCFAMVHM